MRTGERPSRPGSRQVSSGSSASAVPLPIMIASWRGAQMMGALPRFLAGDPAARAGARRDAAIERGRELEGDQRPAGAHAQEEAGVQALRLVLRQPDRDLDAGLAQLLDAAAVDPRVRVARRDHRAPDAGMEQRHGAGRRVAVVRAGLEA